MKRETERQEDGKRQIKIGSTWGHKMKKEEKKTRENQTESQSQNLWVS
jgi:hypothetical protein